MPVTPGLFSMMTSTVTSSPRDALTLERRRVGVLSALALDEEQADFTEGLCAGREDGWAWVHPESDRPECVIVGEAADMETADELCNLYFDKVVRALGSAGQCPVPLAAAGRNTKSAAID